MILQNSHLEALGLTVALAIKAKDGILVAADKRETSTHYAMRKSDSASKIKRIGRNCAVAFCGNGGIGTTLLERYARSGGGVDLDTWVDCRDLADNLSGFLKDDPHAEKCSFLVCGYAKDGARKTPCIKQLEPTLDFFPNDCISKGFVSMSLGRGWLLDYFQQVLGIEFDQCTMTELEKTVIFVLQETASTVLDVGPTFDLYQIREDDCRAVEDYRSSLCAVSALREGLRKQLQSELCK